MGRAIKNTTLKVGGRAGPLGKGVPMTKAAGPGGIATPGWTKSPRMKGLFDRAIAAGKHPERTGGGGVPDRRLWNTFGGKSGSGNMQPPPGGNLFQKTLFGKFGLGSEDKFNDIFKQRMGQIKNMPQRKGLFGKVLQQVQDKNPNLSAPSGKPMGGGGFAPMGPKL